MGDSIDIIANRFFVDVSEIIYDNQLIYPYELALGQALFIGENSSQGEQNQSTEQQAGEASNEVYLVLFAMRFVMELRK